MKGITDLIERINTILRNMTPALLADYESKHESSVGLPRKRTLLLLHPFKVLKALIGRDIYISHIDLVVTTVCSLKCKGCGALMEYYRHPSHIDVADVIASLERLLGAVARIHRIHVLGGEPLCYPQLHEVLSYLIFQNKVDEVGITTNGTLLINDDKVREVLKFSKFRVEISDYGEVSKHKNDLIQQLEDNDIKYIIRSRESDWIDFGDFSNRCRSKIDLKNIFMGCGFKWYCSVLNGKLFCCTRAAHGTNIGLIPACADYVDLMEGGEKKLQKRLFHYLYGSIPFIEACNYCNGTNNPHKIQAGAQVHS